MSLEHLINKIYHERQQPGSMLCAQHALNNLLQGNYFTAPDLSVIANNLDLLERSYDANHTGSSNMDDTGFFSVQVLENALNVWGLGLVRWRGEDMRPYQDRPHAQLAFILNLDQHWFTLRRFGQADTDFTVDGGNGHWFNLNSSLPKPEWVGQLYLGMVLQQAEVDGYSVFAVTQINSLAPLALPRTEVDEIASALPEPASSGRPSFEPSKTPSTSSSIVPRPQTEGFEDEDFELQIALQASLAGRPYEQQILTPPDWPFTSPPLREPVPTSQPEANADMPVNDAPMPSAMQGEESDPVTASMNRNRRMLQRMQAEQRLAQRELWEENYGAADTALEDRRIKRGMREDEEAEQLRRAIEESGALPSISQNPVDDTSSAVEHSSDSAKADATSNEDSNNRVYDDDDAELQAALEASLGRAPQGWDIPQPRSQQFSSWTEPTLTPPTSTPSAHANTEHEHEMETDDTHSTLSFETSDDISSRAATIESVTVDELRKRRLARFGN